tara:strand:- start:519 stop:842 length:324 start_codon:yes stop_codon:yes gene_type:complete
MIKSKNKFISWGLSLLLLIAILDLNHHHEHEHLNGYSLFDLSSEVSDFHETSNQCVKCLTKIQRFTSINSFDFSFQDLSSVFYFSEEMIFDILINFDLNSRPPPFLL